MARFCHTAIVIFLQSSLSSPQLSPTAVVKVQQSKLSPERAVVGFSQSRQSGLQLTLQAHHPQSRQSSLQLRLCHRTVIGSCRAACQFSTGSRHGCSLEPTNSCRKWTASQHGYERWSVAAGGTYSDIALSSYCSVQVWARTWTYYDSCM